MLGKRSRPTIGKLAGALRSGIMDSSTSPRSPLECKMQSPRGLKNYDQGGIGLGIVVALDKPTTINGTCGGGGEVLAKYAICGQFSTRSTPIPVTPIAKNDYKNRDNKNNSGTFKEDINMMMDCLDEEFTYVTSHGPNKSITTRVYYDGGEYAKISQNAGVLKISPVRSIDDNRNNASGPTSVSDHFLNSCHLCKKALHGKDIYMYRGEKAFCSAECRQRQIGIDERKEQCRSEASRSGELSSSPCTYTGSARGQIFFSTGIVAV